MSHAAEDVAGCKQRVGPWKKLISKFGGVGSID
jgi:hypothetical protein